MGCLFCDIADGKIACEKVLETDSLLAFRDISPQAPVHILLITKKHIENSNELGKEDSDLHKEIFKTITKITDQEKLVKNGFRVITNTGPDGGQVVKHVHFHILGGRKMNWPPG